ncbi:MAG TPA: Gfo/Idh/MocA family oxidoreductase [Magnetospirillaceae bacterium]|nr:Gfo/Idh/MocA family oxidoreductase [Magnetospirillaceae bacterium]
MEELRFALYGYGKVAELHARALSTLAGKARMVSVIGRDKAKREAFAGRWGVPARGSAAEAGDRDHAEAVLVTTPHPLHAAHSLEASQAGLHVIVEKPMAISVAECDSMIAAAAAAGKELGVICQRRWYPAVRRVREALDSGRLAVPVLGQVVMLGWRDEPYYRSDPWRGSWAGEGGGVLVNQAPHQLDLLAWFMGPVLEVSAYWANLNHPYIEVEDTAVASLRFAGGALGSILVSNSQKPGIYAKVHVHGSNGASAGVQTDGGAMFIAGMSGVLEPPVNDIWTVPGEEHRLAEWKAEDETFFKTMDPTWWFFARQIEDFSAAVREGRRPAATGRDGRETLRLVEGIYASGRAGVPVRPAP